MIEIADCPRIMKARTTQISRRLEAPPEAVYRALVEPDLVAAWRFPEGMTIEVHDYDLRVGGRFRISLTYQDPDSRGKTSEHTDTYHGHFSVLDPNARVVQVIEFESDDLAMQGQMTIAFVLRPDGSGTRVEASHENVPPGVALSDNELGWRMALDRLASLEQLR